jgi:bacillithiol system protein YtxJ
MKDRMYAITTPEEAELFIEHKPVVALFKAGTCHKTMQGWGNIERLLRERPEIPVGIIQVVQDRPASNHVAERTGIVHHSPQIILFRDGQPLFDLDNWNITLENLEPLLERYAPETKQANLSGGSSSNLGPYKRLMDAYLGGSISEPQFQYTYLNMFREDASLRSQEEFAMLNSLFGNPDEHHIHPQAILMHEQQNPQTVPLRTRVEELRAQIEGM